MSVVSSRNDGPPESASKVIIESIEQAAFWIGVLHRRSVEDARELEQCRERLRRLEAPWWRMNRS